MADITQSELFQKVRNSIPDALLIAWDGCHKIYLAMDEIKADWFKDNYQYVFTDTPELMLAKLGEWWPESCELRFISAVSHNEQNPNDGYVTLIAQFEDEEFFEDDGEDWDDD
jgi:hypothetical protein